MAGYPPNWTFMVASFIGLIMCLLPLRWHMQAYNVGTCAYMIWVAIGCLNLFINAVIWDSNAILRDAWFCDISTRITIAMDVAMPICSLVINRRLYFIATSDTVLASRKERRRAVIVDLLLAVGVPILIVILTYIPQGNRFNIYENWGCYPSIYNTWVAILIYNVPPVAIGCVSAVYCALTIIAFNRRRLQFKEILSGHSNLNANRYFRLMFMACVDIVCTIPLGVWVLILNAGFVRPWISWDNTHASFMNVYQFPALIWQNQEGAFGIELQRWLTPFGAWVFFVIFGIHGEARKNYVSVLSTIASKFGGSTTFLAGRSTMNSNGSTSKSGGTLPVFVERKVHRKRDSLESFTDMSMSQDSDMKKSFAGDASFGGFSFADIGGALNEKDTDTESTSSSSSSPRTPHAPASSDELNIEISSVHRMSMVDAISVPPRTLDIMQVPRARSPNDIV